MTPRAPLVKAAMEVTALRGLFHGGGASALKRGELKIDATVLTGEKAALLSSEAGGRLLPGAHLLRL